MASWGYEEKNGPEKWHKDFPVAKEGKRQSPIDLKNDVESEKELSAKVLSWNYVPANNVNIENTGASWKVNVQSNKESTLCGGGLDGEYELWQFHAHWGDDDCRGSEHTVDGKMYPAELHLVHWNRSKYDSPNVAAGEPDGLAVLGIFLEVGSEHQEFKKICDKLTIIPNKGDKVSFADPEKIDPAKLLPKKDGNAPLDFWRYEGSLTTPPLLESVIWTVFKKPIQISQDQMNCMRNLECNAKDAPVLKMVNNYRPPCPLGSRVCKQT